MSSINWNINTIVFAVLVGMPFLGIIIGESRLKRTTMAVFVGIVLAQSTTGFVHDHLAGTAGGALDPQSISLIIFVATVALMNIGPVPHHETSSKISIRIMVLSSLLTLLFASSLLTFAPDANRANLMDQSFILSFIYNTRLIWLAASVLWLIVLNMWPQHDGKKKH